VYSAHQPGPCRTVATFCWLCPGWCADDSGPNIGVARSGLDSRVLRSVPPALHALPAHDGNAALGCIGSRQDTSTSGHCRSSSSQKLKCVPALYRIWCILCSASHADTSACAQVPVAHCRHTSCPTSLAGSANGRTGSGPCGAHVTYRCDDV
jgi:hypothetical protein